MGSLDWESSALTTRLLLYFLRNSKKKQLEIIIAWHLCTKNLDGIIYSSWDIECDRLKLVIMGYFLSFYPHPHSAPLKPLQLRILKKWNKYLEMWSFCTCVPKITIIMMYAAWDMECDWHNFLLFWLFFYLFTPLTTTKIKIWKKCKQAWRNYPFTHVYHKWGSYHYFSCDIRCNGQLFVILGHLLPFDLPNNPKYQNFEK